MSSPEGDSERDVFVLEGTRSGERIVAMELTANDGEVRGRIASIETGSDAES